jgi:hypothetical protein
MSKSATAVVELFVLALAIAGLIVSMLAAALSFA